MHKVLDVTPCKYSFSDVSIFILYFNRYIPQYCWITIAARLYFKQLIIVS